MKIHKIEEDINVHVIKNSNFSYDVLLGLDAIQKFRLIQDENLNILQSLNDKNIEKIENIQEGSLKTHLNYVEEDASGFTDKIKHLEEGKRNKIFELIKLENQKAHIKLIENRYISKKPYRCSIPDEREIECQNTKLPEGGLIEESQSPYAAPVTLAFKKEEGRRSRLCIDFRELNKILVPESQPFPRIEDIIVKTRNCKWYSVLDINSAFWSVPIKLKDHYKTVLVTQTGHYQWKRLPFGLKISPSIFQRVLSTTIRRQGLSDFCVNYIQM